MHFTHEWKVQKISDNAMISFNLETLYKDLCSLQMSKKLKNSNKAMILLTWENVQEEWFILQLSITRHFGGYVIS